MNLPHIQEHIWVYMTALFQLGGRRADSRAALRCDHLCLLLCFRLWRTFCDKAHWLHFPTPSLFLSVYLWPSHSITRQIWSLAWFRKFLHKTVEVSTWCWVLPEAQAVAAGSSLQQSCSQLSRESWYLRSTDVQLLGKETQLLECSSAPKLTCHYWEVKQVRYSSQRVCEVEVFCFI